MLNRIFYILLLICCFDAYAQNVPILEISDSFNVNVENISIEDGLSQGMVFSLIEDSDGYIWLGTKDGLNRYNGTSFKVFIHNPFDSTSISENVIRHIYQDSNNRIWIATETKGVNLYIP